MSQVREKRDDPHRSLLLLRFALLNLLAFGLVGVAYLQGLLAVVFTADQTYLTAVIAVVFVGGFAICTLRIWETSRELDRLRNFNPLLPSRASAYLAQLRGVSGGSRSLMASSLRLKLSQRISAIRHIANSLVLLGLIGTVIGFVIALSGVDPDKAADVSSIAPMVSSLIEGMSTALYTTLVGAVLNLWLSANFQLLSSGTVKLLTSLVEFGERHGRS